MTVQATTAPPPEVSLRALTVTDPKFQAFQLTCPHPQIGSAGFANWISALYNMAQGAPTLTALSPNTAVHGGGPLSITLTGTKFVIGCAAFSGATQLATTFVSATSLTAVLTTALLAAAATLTITVQNPDSQASAGVSFTVT